MGKNDKDLIKKYLKGVENDLDTAVHNIESLELELSTLEKLTKFTQSITDKLIELYDANFPKKCNTCGKMYHSRNEFLTATFPLRKRGTIFAHEEVMEHRNCICGSTLCIAFDDRRDNTAFGAARRELFSICLNKLEKLTNKDREELIPLVRKVFKGIIIDSETAKNIKK